ncbi:MAG: hypothetical protein ACPGID_06800 [Rubricella sp.]
MWPSVRSDTLFVVQSAPWRLALISDAFGLGLIWVALVHLDGQGADARLVILLMGLAALFLDWAFLPATRLRLDGAAKTATIEEIRITGVRAWSLSLDLIDHVEVEDQGDLRNPASRLILACAGGRCVAVERRFGRPGKREWIANQINLWLSRQKRTHR